MKIFISWSGPTSHQIARALHDALPRFHNSFQPIMSTVDIGAGRVWFEEITSHIDECDAGICCICPDNVASSWMHFEAGAVFGEKAGEILGEKRRRPIVPLIFGMDKLAALKSSPLGLLQAREGSKDDLRGLIQEFAKNERFTGNNVSERTLSVQFEGAWPDLEKATKEALSAQQDIRGVRSPHADKSASQVHPASATILAQYKDLDLLKIFRESQTEIRCLVLSGRNLITPNVVSLLQQRMRAKSEARPKIQILAMNPLFKRTYAPDRDRMMNVGKSKHRYEADLSEAMEHAHNLALHDPTHSILDMRFYNFMPTSYFILADDTAYVTSVLSKPLADCPTFIFHRKDSPQAFATLEDHFAFYWESSPHFVNMIGIDTKGRFLMVKNRARRWEFPGGFIEPTEEPEQSAVREFLEETGYSVHSVHRLRDEPDGKYFAGKVGLLRGKPSAREIEAVNNFEKLPPESELSFGYNYELFKRLVCDARKKFRRPAKKSIAALQKRKFSGRHGSAKKKRVVAE